MDDRLDAGPRGTNGGAPGLLLHAMVHRGDVVHHGEWSGVSGFWSPLFAGEFLLGNFG